MPGGQPSTMQPIAGPWLSPQVVTRNMWPNVLCDMGAASILARGTHSPGRRTGATQAPAALSGSASGLPPSPAAGLEQEPRPPLGFVDPHLQQAGGCHVAMLVTQI